MKNPRELLFERHRHAEPKLDAIRAQVLAERGEKSAPNERGTFASWFHPAFVLSKLWRELVLPCRQVWIGLATAWVAIVLVNLAGNYEPSPRAMAKAAKPNAEFIAALREQKHLLAQLLDTDILPQPATRPHPPGPRSERREAVMIG